MNVVDRLQGVEAFRSLVAERLGLQFEDSKLGELAELLERRVSMSKEPPDKYLDGLAKGSAELRNLAHALTVHETYFFRNGDQFRAFTDFVLPDRMRANASSRRLRILSAGCASGEEPYSLAMLLAERNELSGWSVSIKGLDVSTAMLDAAAAGRYSAWALRDTPAETRARYFTTEGRDFVLDRAIKNQVRFEEHNLADPEKAGPLESEVFDIIFCRNMIMYFTPDAARRTVARFSRSLAPGGFLFLGHAETLRGLSQDFHLRQSHGTFYYQLKEPGTAPSNPSKGHSSTPALGTRAAPPILSTDDSWVDTIRHASERIQALTDPARRLPTEPAPAPGGHNLDAALDLLHRERFSEASSLLGALPKNAARDPDVLLLKAVLMTHGGDLAAAERLSRELLDIDELNAGAHYIVALCRESAGDRRGALEHDEAARYIDPTFAMPQLHLGLLARRSGDRDHAREELQRALTLLLREDAARVLMFGGGFNRDALLALCRAELDSCGGPR